MKWSFLLFAAVSFLCSGCSHLPRVHPPEASATAGSPRSCPDPFPKGKWQLVHSIEAVMPGGRSAFVTGVAVISAEDRSFRCVIMTIEGLAVFEAEWDRRLTVNRAIAPFDLRPFAEGLAEDIRLLFFQPRGSPVESGFLGNGSAICRYRESDGGVVDVVSRTDGNGEIRRYSPDLYLLRSVNLAHGKKRNAAGIPSKLELTAHGDQGYRLIMSLVEAVPVEE